MNEEEVKVKLVLPFLESLGLRASDLKLETSFYLKVGRHLLDMSTGKKTERDGVGARLDILVKRDGANLFIVETKESGHQLDDADRDQAISYARLVHPIAPYALVTNGAEWALFDAVSKERLDKQKIQIDGSHQIALPDDAKNEAVAFFFGYSNENVSRFCRSQVEKALRPLMGSASDLQKKFIPELHVPDPQLAKEVESFLRSGKSGFLLLADSGMGKTCEMCYHALKLLHERGAVLFFQGILLDFGIAEAIAAEFNWTFTEQRSAVELLRRLLSVLRDRPLVVFVDGIDEWQHAQKVQYLLGLLRHAQDEQLKIVVSCKSAAWPIFSVQRGTPTGVEEYIYPIKNPNKSMEDASNGYALKGFDPPALLEAIHKYAESFQVRASFEDAVIEQAKQNPFLLRVFFEVAKTTGVERLTFSSLEFFQKYYRALLTKTGNPELAEAQINAIAKCLFESNIDSVELQPLRASLGLGLTEALLPALFECNILNKSPDDSARVSFYFQQLRDFIIAFNVLGWPPLTQEKFAASLRSLASSGLHEDVISFYYRLAPEHQKRAIDGPLYSSALEYLRLYERLIGEHFPALRHAFRPHTTRRIGFIAEIILSKRRLGVYGFRELGTCDEDVLFVPSDAFFSAHNLIFVHGGNELHYAGSANGFAQIDVKREVVKNELEWQLNDLVEHRTLNEESCPALLRESLSGVVLSHANFLSDFVTQQGRILKYPLHYARIREAVRQEALRRHFLDEAIEEKRKRGDVVERREGQGMTYSVRFSPAEEVAIEDQVRLAISSGLRVRSRYSDIQELERELNPVLNILESTGTAAQQQWIERSMLFDALRTEPNVGLADTKEYLQRLFEAFLEAYETLVTTNFPTIKQHFWLKAQMPVCVFIGVSADVVLAARSGCHVPGSIQIIICKPAQPTVINQVIACDSHEIIGHFPNFAVRGQNYQAQYMTVNSLLEFTFSSNANIGIPRKQQKFPLRDLVYGQMHHELPHAMNQLRGMLGVEGG